MPPEEKRLLLRARVSALRDRALLLIATFTEPAMQERAAAVLRHLDGEMKALQDPDRGTPLPRLRQYLPDIVHRIERLERIARTHGPHADARAVDATAPRPRPSAVPARRIARGPVKDT
jgi:hypothetical protein